MADSTTITFAKGPSFAANNDAPGFSPGARTANRSPLKYNSADSIPPLTAQFQTTLER